MSAWRDQRSLRYRITHSMRTVVTTEAIPALVWTAFLSPVSTCTHYNWQLFVSLVWLPWIFSPWLWTLSWNKVPAMKHLPFFLPVGLGHPGVGRAVFTLSPEMTDVPFVLGLSLPFCPVVDVPYFYPLLAELSRPTVLSNSSRMCLLELHREQNLFTVAQKLLWLMFRATLQRLIFPPFFFLWENWSLREFKKVLKNTS